MFTWGDTETPRGKMMANTWQGDTIMLSPTASQTTQAMKPPAQQGVSSTSADATSA
jgi:hypothetical protein